MAIFSSVALIPKRRGPRKMERTEDVENQPSMAFGEVPWGGSSEASFSFFSLGHIGTRSTRITRKRKPLLRHNSRN